MLFDWDKSVGTIMTRKSPGFYQEIAKKRQETGLLRRDALKMAIYRGSEGTDRQKDEYRKGN